MNTNLSVTPKTSVHVNSKQDLRWIVLSPSFSRHVLWVLFTTHQPKKFKFHKRASEDVMETSHSIALN